MKTRDMTYIALFTAIMAALGFIPPLFLAFTPVPITLQTLGVMLAGGILGSRLGALSQIVFLFLVAAGLPLLSGGRGGLAVFTSPSAGYLLGYAFAAFGIGYMIERFRSVSFWKVLLTNILFGILLIYLFGIPVQAFFMNVDVIHTAKLSLVYLPGDLLKAVMAAFLVGRLRKAIVNRSTYHQSSS
ncbi:biotin transporter BioY [Metabacillus arenae]|uniref:Biotin transporter n=1 Tax=Metabacillus arenae TaxID=2771434 RepID=A0A926NLY0_9BACI|nr:biotin transporter BioY [Metabacillus arenae]MBD1380241.1 biotin transporter BioY [Metabacillus arenae]